jgi:hypothetical protein
MVQPPPAPRKWQGVPGDMSWPRMVPAIQPSQQAVQLPQLRAGASAITRPQHCLYLAPLPQEQGSLRPGFIRFPHAGAGSCRRATGKIWIAFLYEERWST